MQRTADLHDQILDTRLPEAADVVDAAAALDATVDGLDAHAPTGDAPMRGFLRACELPSARLPGRHDDLHPIAREGQEAEILEPPAPCRQGVRGGIGHALIVGTARIGLTQTAHRECRVDQPHVFHRRVCFLAAIRVRLLRRLLGALDAPVGPIVATRGEAGTGTAATVGRAAGGGDPAGGSTIATAAALATPRHVANSIKDRVGASSSMRRVARSTTKRA